MWIVINKFNIPTRRHLATDVDNDKHYNVTLFLSSGCPCRRVRMIVCSSPESSWHVGPVNASRDHTDVSLTVMLFYSEDDEGTKTMRGRRR